MAANASPAATRSYAAIAQEVEGMLGEAARADAAEDQRWGQARGDELPPGLADRRSRRARLARCKQELEQAHADAQAAHQAKLEERAAREAKMSRRLAGRKPQAPDPAELTTARRNVTDPDSRPLRRAGRAVQGYNAQVVASPEQVILAAEVTQAANDAAQPQPMVARAQAALRSAGVGAPIGTVVADGGYWSSPAISAVRERGVNVLIPTRDRPRTRPRRLAPRQGPEARRIEAALATSEGRALYRRRQQIVEPVFAPTKVLRRADRFMRRGLAACQAAWRLIAATHNLLKLWRAQLAV